MTFSHLNRRLHLYLGLALLPWFFMYGISSVPFAHNQFFEQRDAAKGLPAVDAARGAHARHAGARTTRRVCAPSARRCSRTPASRAQLRRLSPESDAGQRLLRTPSGNRPS